MTRKEIETALIQMGMFAKSIVADYAPNANQVHITVVNGTISVTACQWDNVKDDFVERGILNATLFDDGTLFSDGRYEYPPNQGEVSA